MAKNIVDKLRAFWKPDGENVHKENEHAILQAIKKVSVEETSVAFVLHAKEYRALRSRLVKSLKLD